MSDFSDRWHAWREDRETALRSPRGWLAITAIHWLGDVPERFDDVPGAWSGDERGATVELAAGESLGLDGRVLTEGVHLLGPLGDVGLTVTFDDAVAQVADRDGRPIVRPRHPGSPNLRAYRGTPSYPPDPAWVLPARFEPYAAPVGDAIGEVAFLHRGDEHRLTAWDADDGRLWILFRDATSGVTTYPANRQLVTAAPSADGTVDLDFNRAYNMPCAYTDFATCPVLPSGNTLPFAVEAGEQLPLMVAQETPT